MADNKINVGGRFHSIATGNVLAGANEILDDSKNKKQSVINAEVDAAIADRYTKEETYNKDELNSLITTPGVQYVTVAAIEQTTAVTDVLPATGAADTIYRVGNWDGTQYNDSVFSEYAWNGSAYIKLSTKSQIGEVYDISANHADTKYADLATALGTNGENVPEAVRKGGMSVKFIQSSDNKYVQFRCMSDEFTTDISAWQGVDAEPTAGSHNLVTGGGLVNYYGGYIENPEWKFVITDSEKHVVAGIKANGEIEWVLGVPTPIKKYISELLSALMESISASLETKEDKVEGKGLIDSEFSSNISYEENPEFATAEVDSEKKLLGGRKLNGIRFEKIGFETPLLLIGKNQCYTYNDPENRATLIVDKNNKVVSYRDRNGVLHEKAGIKTPFLNTRNLIISDEGVKNLIALLLSNGLKDNNNWINKNIWWCGTSIPAAGFWNVDNAQSYPHMVGEQLGAKKVFNEAVGSSCARKLMYTNSTYEVISRQMGNTISDALAICADTWTIDDANQTFTNGPRTLGITDIPTVSTYSAACYQRMLLLSNSYEIKLVSKYLISDPEENESYLREKFGLLYDTLVALHPTAYTYQSDIDLFVIDHGHNDSPTPVPTEDVDSLVMTTFIGAINNYISLIMKYKPHTRIVFISDYDNSRLTDQTIEAQKQIATNWHIPFIDLREYLPFNINVKVKTRGYWATNGIWQEDGFIYDSTAADVAHAFSVNGNAYFPRYVGTTIQEIAEHINPQQDSNGVWWYEYEPRYIYIKDGLHPHTDKSGKCLKLYADVLASFINYVGNNNF